jgi:hypothetical protein
MSASKYTLSTLLFLSTIGCDSTAPQTKRYMPEERNYTEVHFTPTKIRSCKDENCYWSVDATEIRDWWRPKQVPDKCIAMKDTGASWETVQILEDLHKRLTWYIQNKSNMSVLIAIRGDKSLVVGEDGCYKALSEPGPVAALPMR